MHNTTYAFPSTLRPGCFLNAVVNSDRTVKYDATGGQILAWESMTRDEMADLIRSHRASGSEIHRHRTRLDV